MGAVVEDVVEAGVAVEAEEELAAALVVEEERAVLGLEDAVEVAPGGVAGVEAEAADLRAGLVVGHALVELVLETLVQFRGGEVGVDGLAGGEGEEGPEQEESEWGSGDRTVYERNGHGFDSNNGTGSAIQTPSVSLQVGAGSSSTFRTIAPFPR